MLGESDVEYEKYGQQSGKRNVAIEAGDCWCDMCRMKTIVEKLWVGHAPNMLKARSEVWINRGHRGA